MLPTVSLALAVLAQVPPAAPPAATERVSISAERLSYEAGLVHAVGRTHVKTDGASLRADEIRYDQNARTVTARGNVMLAVARSGYWVALADGVTVKLDGSDVTEVLLDNGVLLKKQKTTAEALFAAQTPDELRKLGSTALVMSGSRLERDGDEWRVHDLKLTPCDCDPTQPSWRVQARYATVDLEEQYATLQLPSVWVKSVPVFWLPWIALPLSDRRSGLLAPKPVFNGPSGFSLDLPVFITLGDSYDATLTPGYYAGLVDSKGNPVSGVKGPRLQTEFRYAPSTRTSGRFTFGLIDDQHPTRDPVNGAPTGGRRGVRSEGSIQHSQELGGGWHDRIDASFVSDGFYVQDLTADIIAREAEYLRSTAVLFRRSEGVYAGIEVGLRQDLGAGGDRRWGYGFFDPAGPNTLQRLPALTVAVPDRPLLGPIRAAFRLEYARLAPLLGATGDEGVLADEGRPYAVIDGQRQPLRRSELHARLFCPGCGLADTGEADRIWQPGEREARDRLDLLPRLSTSLSFGRFGTVTPYAAYRQDVYLGEVTGRLSHRGYPLFGVSAETALARTFGDLKHTLAPSAEIRYVPAVFGDEPAPYDEIDTAFPLLPGERRFLHGVVELRQQLLARNGQAVREVARLDLGQGFDLLSRDWGDAAVRASVAHPPFTFSALARIDVATGTLAQLSANLSVDSGRGDALYAAYERLDAEGSRRTRQSIDALVGPPAPKLEDAFAEQLTFGGRASLRFGLTLSYDVLVQRTTQKLSVGQHVLGLSYGPACDCWRVSGYLAQRAAGPALLTRMPEFGITLTLSRFGSFGT